MSIAHYRSVIDRSIRALSDETADYLILNRQHSILENAIIAIASIRTAPASSDFWDKLAILRSYYALIMTGPTGDLVIDTPLEKLLWSILLDAAVLQ